MQLRHILARLAKREARCMPSCPGWRVVDRADGRTSRAVACAECNAKNPSSRRIDDAMARSMPAALDAVRSRDANLHAQRRERNTTYHLRTGVASFAVPCGHALGRTPGGRRRHLWTYDLADVTCPECARLGAMTPEQRAADRVARFSKFDAKKAEIEETRAKEREQRRSEIEEMRPTAMVALDLVESQIRPTTEMQEMLDSALRWAVAAYKHDHPKSRGDRLHVLRDVDHGVGHQCCRFCGSQLRASVHVGADRTMEGAHPDVASHTVPCALKYLGGSLIPRPPAPPSETEEDL